MGQPAEKIYTEGGLGLIVSVVMEEPAAKLDGFPNTPEQQQGFTSSISLPVVCSSGYKRLRVTVMGRARIRLRVKVRVRVRVRVDGIELRLTAFVRVRVRVKASVRVRVSVRVRYSFRVTIRGSNSG